MKVRRIKCVLCPYKEVCIPEMESRLTKLDELDKQNKELQLKLKQMTEKINAIILRLENARSNIK